MARLLLNVCSIDELVRVLLATRGAQPITFTARTDAGVRAKDKDKNPNPYPRPIWKTATVNAMVNFWYDRGVYRRLKAEGKSPNAFRQGSSWHDPIMIGKRLTPLCQGKSEENRNFYLRVMCLSTVLGPDYHDAHGQPLTNTDVAPFLKPRNEYRNQGLGAPLVFKTYSLANVTCLTLQGQSYLVKDAKCDA